MHKKECIYMMLLILNISWIIVCEERNATNRLSRRRRYLIFPEGSSLQLVYDQIVPIVGYTNLFIFGLTVALAWRLPDKVDYPEKKNKISRKHGTSANRNSSTETHKKMLSFEYEHFKPENYHNYHVDNKYRSYLMERIANKLKGNGNYYPIEGYRPKTNLGRNFLNKNLLDPAHSFNSSESHRLKYQRHFLYPALRMRREAAISDESNLDVCHLYQHFSTRNDLYTKIAKYLDAKGENGADCVKRAICETAEIAATLPTSSFHRPSTFVKEILRVIFSLPAMTLLAHGSEDGGCKSNNHKHYDNWNSKTNCSLQYPKCSVSFWNEEFNL